VTELQTGRPGFDSRQGWRFLLFAIASRQALVPTLSPIEWAPGEISPGVKLTTHLHQVPRLRMRAAIHLLPNKSSWRGA